MKKFLFFLIFPVLIFSEIKIDIEMPDKFFEIKNYVKNGGFETKGIWKEYGLKTVDGQRVNEIIGEYTQDDKYSGNFSYKIKGKRGVDAGISQGISFSEPLEGGYLYLSYRVKIKGITDEGGVPGPSIQVTYTDNESKYMPYISLQKGTYNWDEIKWMYEVPKPIKSLTLYLTYYNQEGECYYDDVVLSFIKKGKIKYKIDGEGIKRVKLYSDDGLISDSGEIKELNKYEGEVEILPVKNYYIEVEDVKGNRYVKTIPEIKREEKKGEVNISYIPQEKILKGGEKDYIFRIKKEEGRKYILHLKARLHSEKIAGHTNALEINLNGEMIKVERLIERGKNFTMASGKTYDVGTSNFRVYYSPFFVIPPEDNPYFPVDIPENDPYTYKFDITDILKDGENKIIIKHHAGVENPLIIKDLKVIEK
ncbi:MAG: hypothetical protein NC926_05980 [Candidatus Omnitrophica bacterium]|nr:hypothetical protein [Candidatus Omnitrophota bacterium]MCM8807478.1 hypothetical protein [Candidatus Omnitrophota bacterium]